MPKDFNLVFNAEKTRQAIFAEFTRVFTEDVNGGSPTDIFSRGGGDPNAPFAERKNERYNSTFDRVSPLNEIKNFTISNPGTYKITGDVAPLSLKQLILYNGGAAMSYASDIDPLRPVEYTDSVRKLFPGGIISGSEISSSVPGHETLTLGSATYQDIQNAQKESRVRAERFGQEYEANLTLEGIKTQRAAIFNDILQQDDNKQLLIFQTSNAADWLVAPEYRFLHAMSLLVTDMQREFSNISRNTPSPAYAVDETKKLIQEEQEKAAVKMFYEQKMFPEQGKLFDEIEKLLSGSNAVPARGGLGSMLFSAKSQAKLDLGLNGDVIKNEIPSLKKMIVQLFLSYPKIAMGLITDGILPLRQGSTEKLQELMIKVSIYEQSTSNRVIYFPREAKEILDNISHSFSLIEDKLNSIIDKQPESKALLDVKNAYSYEAPAERVQTAREAYTELPSYEPKLQRARASSIFELVRTPQATSEMRPS